MSATTKTCIEVECDECRDGWAESDYGIPHFKAEDDLAQQLADLDWTVEDGKHYCRECSAVRICSREGHEPRVLPAFTDNNGRMYQEVTYCTRCNHSVGIGAPASTGEAEHT